MAGLFLKSKSRMFYKTIELVRYTFVIALLAFLVILVLDAIWEESVSSHLNLNYLFVIVGILGMVAFGAAYEQGRRSPKTSGRRDIILSSSLGVLGAVIIGYGTEETGWFRYLLAVISGSIIAGLTLLILRAEDEREDRGNC